jgi:quercetin dioxygenase-like cupin family protein
MVTQGAKGVVDSVRSAVDLTKEALALDGRLFRLRQLDIEPGGIVPWHSHGERPAQIYIVKGSIIARRHGITDREAQFAMASKVIASITSVVAAR